MSRKVSETSGKRSASGKRDKALRERVGGRTVMVTGASSGIGEALAHRLGDAGAHVLLVARSVDKLQELRGAIEARGGVASVYGCDLADGADAQKLVTAVLAEHGHVDVLVNNAGISIRRSVSKSYDRVHDFERTLALNFLGAVRLILGFLPVMRERRDGHILNVSTMGVQVNVPRYGAYVASKAALDAFSRIVGIEALRDGVKVTTVYMPLVKTPMMESTTIYDAFPMRTAEEAAELIIDGIVRQPKRVAVASGNVFEFAYGIAPGAVDRLLNAGYRAFPESGDKRDQQVPSDRDTAMFHKVLRAVKKRSQRRRREHRAPERGQRLS